LGTWSNLLLGFVLDGLDWIWIGTGWIGGLDWIGGMILQETPLARVADPTHALLTTVCAMFNADASHGFFFFVNRNQLEDNTVCCYIDQ
jgi:hypothetical protein